MAKILVLGGHGAISLLLTSKLLTRGYTVTSLIRNESQSASISALGESQPGKVEILVHSLEEVKSDAEAKGVLEKAGADWVVWSAGAGGKGGPGRTEAIDKTACIHFIRASISIPSIRKFLLVSALSSRRSPASWWSADDWALIQKMNTQIMPAYYAAKLAADEVLAVLGEQREGFVWISLRPGMLTDEPESGKVSLGKTKARGGVSRADVAEVAFRLLEKVGAKGWIDLLDGEEAISDAVERVVRDHVDCIEGESLNVMQESLQKP